MILAFWASLLSLGAEPVMQGQFVLPDTGAEAELAKKSRKRKKRKKRRRRRRPIKHHEEEQGAGPAWLFPGVGMLGYHLGRYTESEDGSGGAFGELAAEIVIITRARLSDRLRLLPALRGTPLTRETGDAAADVRVFRIDVPLGYELRSVIPFDVYLGPGFLLYEVAGKGGTVILNNGNTTSEFGKPSDSQMTRLVNIQAGVGAFLWKQLRFEAGVMVPGILSSRRAFNFYTSLSYGVL